MSLSILWKKKYFPYLSLKEGKLFSYLFCYCPIKVIYFFFFSSQMTWPHPWHPDIVDVQIATIGSLAIVAVPGEFTYVFFGLVLHIASESISFKLPAVLLCVGT